MVISLLGVSQLTLERILVNRRVSEGAFSYCSSLFTDLFSQMIVERANESKTLAREINDCQRKEVGWGSAVRSLVRPTFGQKIKRLCTVIL